MNNLNLLFYKTYYDSLTVNTSNEKVFPAAAKINSTIFSTRFCHEEDYVEPVSMVNHSFLMTVCYPGLLIGIGNTHDSGVGNDEIGVGFSFDYVTGQPYIPASTVKGVLRCHFKDHPEVIMSLCGQELQWVKDLEKEIFDNADVFFDAVVYSGDREGKLLGEEFITPHKSATESPVPIKLLKLLPEVRFSFRFLLKDSEHMEAAKKAELFKQLLGMFGVGAKTNVGFGVLQEDKTNGKPYPKPVPVCDAGQNSQQRNFQPRPQQGRPSRSASSPEPADQDGKKCPHCGRWNKRINPHTGRENWKWIKGICFNCEGSLNE